ncbi:exosome complex RNA-binding protein Rrp4 [Methanobrevibacter ruminantium M1]|uniref:Exosome complex component Rrp4 n=1 Tax=Methanobrevibacter ruminantium (strain ATCC 35063 / DSM 1093 / JCM 13430 / OCM 146 / M1) TaxID=634498 RepID=D3E3U3_METRM|nr:exosome complex RNA-binding protein Rrp4 [Methanobrevibacter ruminantium M1]
MGSICMIYVNEKDLVVPGELLAEDDYYSGRGTFEDDGKICSKLLGLVSLRNKKISVIPLKSKYIPKKGDVVIGKIDDVRFSMWGVDINSPYSGILPASEVFGREKKELSRVFDIGDVLFLRIVDVDEVKKVKLGLKGRGMGKFRGGVIVDIAPTKVPRLIGKKGSMINMIKDKTGCKIVVGQNGLVWVKGNEDMEQIVKNTIKLIEREAHTSGLTDRVKNKLCLLIDGELPEEETEVMEEKEEIVEESFEEGLKKPEIQDFRDEVEKEIAEEMALEESEEDLDEEFDDSEELDDSDEEFDDSEDISDDEDFDDSEDDLDSEEEIDYADSEDDEDELAIEELEEKVETEEFMDDSDEDSDFIEEDIIELDEDAESLNEEDDEEEFDVLEESEAEIFDEAEVLDGAEEISDDELEEVINEAISEDEESQDDSIEDESEDEEEKEKEEKSKKPKFLDTFEYINEQKKKNKSSFDLSRADNSDSPTLNISQRRGI